MKTEECACRWSQKDRNCERRHTSHTQAVRPPSLTGRLADFPVATESSECYALNRVTQSSVVIVLWVLLWILFFNLKFNRFKHIQRRVLNFATLKHRSRLTWSDRSQLELYRKSTLCSNNSSVPIAFKNEKTCIKRYSQYK